MFVYLRLLLLLEDILLLQVDLHTILKIAYLY
jgi:hypothetical protein